MFSDPVSEWACWQIGAGEAVVTRCSFPLWKHVLRCLAQRWRRSPWLQVLAAIVGVLVIVVGLSSGPFLIGAGSSLLMYGLTSREEDITFQGSLFRAMMGGASAAAGAAAVGAIGTTAMGQAALSFLSKGVGQFMAKVVLETLVTMGTTMFMKAGVHSCQFCRNEFKHLACSLHLTGRCRNVDRSSEAR